MLFETVYRGDMYYVDPAGGGTGSEQKSGRPAIIVSNNVGNSHSSIVEVVYLTTQPKSDLPTHVVIASAPQVSTALCEQVTTVSKERLSNYIGNISESEMENIDRALEISLGLSPVPTKDEELEEQLSTISKKERVETERRGVITVKAQTDAARLLARLEAERDTYKDLYNELLTRVIGTRA